MKNPGIVTLITDFGSRGEYSGAMKGAILSVNPRCRIVDITHEIEPQNILQASWVLKNSYPYLPAGDHPHSRRGPRGGYVRRAIVASQRKGIFSLVPTTEYLPGVFREWESFNS